MADNRKMTMKFKVIATIVLAICAVYFTWNVIDLTAKGNHLKEVCTESVMGNVWMLDYDKTHSTYTDAVYDLNGVRYHAYGLKQSGDDLDRPIIVHYNPNRVNEAYCGDKPIGAGFHEYLFMIGTILCVIVVPFIKTEK